MKRIMILSIMALFCADAVAQEEIVLKRWNTGITDCYLFNNKKDKKTTAILPNTENSWIKDTCWLENPPIVDWDSICPGKWNVMTIRKHLWINLECMLANRGDETVLHCYLPLPADEVTNIWLASEDAAIVDMETGIQYRAKRTYPEICMRKHISVKANKPVITNEKALGHGGDVVDFQIIFPKLSVTTKTVAIYGVPMWNMRGWIITLDNPHSVSILGVPYDTVPRFVEPRLIREEKDYNKDIHETWAEYTDVHYIKPVKNNTMALWRTRNATYLAFAKEQNWVREYFDVANGTKLIDEYGNQYKLKSIIGFPIGNLFWVGGYSGDYFAMVLVFEPLPENVSLLTYSEPDLEPFNMWGADWQGMTIRNLNVNELRKNQSLFEYHPRVIKE